MCYASIIVVIQLIICHKHIFGVLNCNKKSIIIKITNAMASEKDLFNAVKETLEKEGKLDKIKAEVKQEVMTILGLSGEQMEKNVEQPKGMTIINEVIREYLDWAGYHHSSTVFSSESSLTSLPMSREELLKALNLEDDSNSRDLPLLYGLMMTCKNKC